jgi:hypothetical protein
MESILFQRDLLIYQPDRPIDADKRVYRVAWYGGESTQLHFQKWCLIATPNFDGDYEWIDLNVRTLMELPTKVKEMWLEMKDYYDFSLSEQLTYSLESCIR